MKLYKLKDVATIEISGVDKKFKEDEIPIYLCNFTDVYYNWAITSDIRNNFIAASANKKEIDRFKLRKGQVALTKDSETRYDIGISTYIAEDFKDVILGYHCALITPNKDKINGKYLNAFIHSDYIRKYFENSASGSGQRYSLSIQTLEDMPILLPSIEKQQHIGKILSDIDRKIALNKAINHNLVAMAKQLYDYWFVQFDFPNQDGKPYKSSGGKMVWNQKLKREIPEGWKEISLFEGIDVQYGFPFSTDSFLEETTDVPIVRIRDIINGTISAYSTEKIDEKFKLKKGDIVMGMDGNFHMNYWHTDKAYLNQRCVRLRPKKDSSISSIQIYYDIQPFIKAKEMNLKGSTVGHLLDKDLKELYLLNSNTNLRNIFDHILLKILTGKIEYETLTKQRNELLPLLMNGQVTVG